MSTEKMPLLVGAAHRVLIIASSCAYGELSGTGVSLTGGLSVIFLSMDERAKFKQFGELVSKRRLALGLNIAQAAERGGLSDKRFGQIERGEGHLPNQSTLSKVDRALNWEPNSSAGALHGDTPPTPLGKKVLSERDVQRLVRFELALQRFGVTQTPAARNLTADGQSGYTLNDETVDALIDILESLPPSS
ncbi:MULTISPECIES: helix-turn-helix domain-containing protein [Nocardia]|uniref:helix-turn-helix domain-containing protein n=1 Tax=Nocardia TaxID=1817 RepID=UPI002457F677|nr:MULTISPECIES: helix-turn-helix transcriptional regulator [Nocardia]